MTDEINTKKSEPSNKEMKTSAAYMSRLFIGMIIASFLFGGIAGVLFSAWLDTNTTAAQWITEEVLGKPYTNQNTPSENTLQITTEESATIDTVEKSVAGVVSIVVTQDLSEIYNQTGPLLPFDDFFQFNIPQQAPEGQQEIGAGTGFIISADGLIVTNKHVVSEQGADYTVVLNDGTQYEASVLDRDPFNDLALLQIEAENLPVLPLGDSENLQIGQTVIAIGNTLGEFSNTVTRGVISGLSRTVTAGSSSGQSETLENIIQTDAAINFGNSGGPLLNLAGEVIGVNTAISREGQLVSFAIPINQAKKIIDSVQEFGRIVRPYLGVRYVLINDKIAEQNNLSVNYGALIVRGDSPAELAVVPGSPADKAGLEENNIILEVNDEQITRDNSLVNVLQQYSPGDEIILTVLSDGEEVTISATLAELEN